jgi:hypothetical protein
MELENSVAVLIARDVEMVTRGVLDERERWNLTSSLTRETIPRGPYSNLPWREALGPAPRHSTSFTLWLGLSLWGEGGEENEMSKSN